jgi:hypothetical protein
MLVMLSVLSSALRLQAQDLQPFVLPWNDASTGPSDVRTFLDPQLGVLSPIRVGADGHFYAGAQRTRLLGVNLTFAACFPDHAAAVALAGRLAKFGVNAVRFHHMDWQQFPDGLQQRRARGDRSPPTSRNLDSEAIDRLDYLIDQLARQGIYADVNLLVSRQFVAGDGLPPQIEQLGWKDRHVVAMFDRHMIELQKEYAKNLLGHVNPYRAQTLAHDPAVAIVEINNENGLVHAWQDRVLDHLPEVFAAELRRQWNAWLAGQYGSTDKLRQAWGARREPLGAEVLTIFPAPGAWNLEQHAGAQARRSIDSLGDAGAAAWRIDVTRAGTQSWLVQMCHPALAVKRGGLYTFSFRAKADSPCTISAVFSRAHEPWDGLSAQVDATLGSAWKTFSVTFISQGDESNARVGFSGMGARRGTYWLADMSLRPGGTTMPQPDQTLEAGNIPLIPRRGPAVLPEEVEFQRFLSATETAYWLEMAGDIKKDLGFAGVVVGTALGYSTPSIQAQLDAIDSHAYAPHPRFPHRPWDPVDWTVANQSEVANRVPGGALAHLALEAVAGKPHLVTEYNQAAPNTYSSEAPLLLAAMAAFQDWDGVFLFDYGGGRGGYDAQKIEGFFAIGQHPTKMANLPLAAALFRRADLEPARDTLLIPMSPQNESGLPPGVAVLHALRQRAGSASPDALRLPPDQKRLTSDTGQMVWDRSIPDQATVTISTARSRILIGFGDGRQFDLGGVILSPGHTLQGWCTLGLTLTQGQSFSGPAQILVVATGLVQNTDMAWKNQDKTTVGRDWGRAPSLVEVVPATVQLPVAAARVAAWALDQCGQHAAQLEVTGDEHRATIRLGFPQRTLWYEFEVR